MAKDTDRIEKRVTLHAPRSRVWRAIADAREFSSWFGVTIETPFTPGTEVSGRIDAKGYEGMSMQIWIERVEPESFFSYRWHPYAIDPKKDYSGEPTTLVEFSLVEVPGGTEVIIVESGFDRIPAERRAEALRSNEGGWATQAENIKRHVEK
jgi:uncharacterized protein YndB with AHSA1/START domain